MECYGQIPSLERSVDKSLGSPRSDLRQFIKRNPGIDEAGAYDEHNH